MQEARQCRDAKPKKPLADLAAGQSQAGLTYGRKNRLDLLTRAE